VDAICPSPVWCHNLLSWINNGNDTNWSVHAKLQKFDFIQLALDMVLHIWLAGQCKDAVMHTTLRLGSGSVAPAV